MTIEFNQKETITKEVNVDFTDAKIIRTESKDGRVFITYEEEIESDQQINRWTIIVTADQFTHTSREINGRPRSREEMAAIYAKKAEAEEEEEVVKPKVVDVIKQAVLEAPKPKVTVIKRVEGKDINWKDTSPEREARKALRERQNADPDKVDTILEYVFRWHSKNDYSRWHDKKYSLTHLLKTLIPDNIAKLPFECCKRYYLAQSYTRVTAKYEFQWKKLVRSVDKQGYGDAVPKYIRDKYSH